MWLEDLARATADLNKMLGAWHGCYTKVLPCANGGIAFYSSDNTHIYKWFPDGRIENHNVVDWRNC